MPSYTMLNIKMQRESNSIPWGFRMQGGRDYGCPLQIQNINPNSLAERFGMRIDDYIIRIGQISTEYFRHQEAQERIKQQNNILNLVLQRGAPPTSADYNSQVNFSSYQSVPLPQSPPQIVVPVANSRVTLGQTYNSPIGLYSNENITDTISRTLKSLNVDSDCKIEEPKILTQVKTTSTKPMPYDYSQQKSNVENKQFTHGSNNRSMQKVNKGTASLNQNENTNQIAICYACGINIRGPFISAIGRCYCVDHFTCSKCKINLIDCGFVEENDKLFCEKDFEQYLAPDCNKCLQKILKECIHALEKTWHPECFTCTACKKSIGSGSFHIEDGKPYCIADYQKMFQAKCTGCEFPIEPTDKYLEALGGIYHAECFYCATCQVSLDGQPFIVKNNRPYCRQHGRQMSAAFH